MKRIIPIAEEILSRKGPLTADAITREIKNTERKYQTPKKDIIVNSKELSNTLRLSDRFIKTGTQRISYHSGGYGKVIVWGLR